MKLVIVLFAIFALTHARVGFGPGEQEWGYATVREGAHMFWWLYYTTADVKNYTERPLIIWLQGGPGASSTGYGNFAELGPLDVRLNARNHTWVKDANVLFLDNPVGTGFSYVDEASALTDTNEQIALDLVEMMKQFYKKNPEFIDTPLYITSESYGGKMAAEFGLLLDQEIKAGKIKCNLKGVGLGDSWVSPIDSVLTWAPYLLQFGFVDQTGYEKIDAAARETQKLVDTGKWHEATTQWGRTEGVIMQQTNNVDFYNVLKKIYWGGKVRTGVKEIAKPAVRDLDDILIEEIMNKKVKQALGLNSTWGSQSGLVFSFLRGDFMKPVTKIVERLLDETDLKVYVFTGQLDLIVDTPGTVIWVDNLVWSFRPMWLRAEKTPIVVNGYIEGYQKQVTNLGLYWVNRAGHMVPADNPAAMDYILRKLTNDYSG